MPVEETGERKGCLFLFSRPASRTANFSRAFHFRVSPLSESLEQSIIDDVRPRTDWILASSFRLRPRKESKKKTNRELDAAKFVLLNVFTLIAIINHFRLTCVAQKRLR